MPWLEKNNVLFIHVPRCGGTSITKFHRVGEKAQKGKNIFQRVGITYYYYRYKLLEKANFPFSSYENAFAFFEAVVATILFFAFPGLILPYVMWCTATSLFFTSSFVFTAPILMRIGWLRNFLMIFLGRLLCGVASDVDYLVGTNEKGYLFHLTAERAIRYGYVSKHEVKHKSFSIVRNPYSRAVSMYEYNKRAFESFEHFIIDFHSRCMEKYHGKGLTDSSDIYCHVLPMHAYTHWEDEQLVGNIIKQEELKHLVATKWKGSDVPTDVQNALTGIPHANGRKKKTKWQDYYTQKTMDLVLEMYEKDFELFGYDKTIPGRKDLRSNKASCTKENVSFKINVLEAKVISVEPEELPASNCKELSHESIARVECEEYLKKENQNQTQYVMPV